MDSVARPALPAERLLGGRPCLALALGIPVCQHHQVLKHQVNVQVVLHGGTVELEAKILGQLLSLVLIDHRLIDEVSLGLHEHHCNFPALRLHLLLPRAYCAEGVPVRRRECQDAGPRSPVVRPGDRVVLLLHEHTKRRETQGGTGEKVKVVRRCPKLKESSSAVVQATYLPCGVPQHHSNVLAKLSTILHFLQEVHADCPLVRVGESSRAEPPNH